MRLVAQVSQTGFKIMRGRQATGMHDQNKVRFFVWHAPTPHFSKRKGPQALLPPVTFLVVAYDLDPLSFGVFVKGGVGGGPGAV